MKFLDKVFIEKPIEKRVGTSGGNPKHVEYAVSDHKVFHIIEQIHNFSHYAKNAERKPTNLKRFQKFKLNFFVHT